MRGQAGVLDSDRAAIHGVSPSAFNQAIQRNLARSVRFHFCSDAARKDSDAPPSTARTAQAADWIPPRIARMIQIEL